MKQQLANLSFANKRRNRERQIRICLSCGSTNTCVNQYGIICRDCGFLWDLE